MDLSEGSTLCNCTSCTKAGWWAAPVKLGHFRLLSGSDALFDSRPNNPMIDGTTCKHCSVTAYGHGNIPEIGGEFYQVNVRCLEDVDVTGLTVQHLDGLHDTWAPLGVTKAVAPVPGARPAPGCAPHTA